MLVQGCADTRRFAGGAVRRISVTSATGLQSSVGCEQIGDGRRVLGVERAKQRAAAGAATGRLVGRGRLVRYVACCCWCRGRSGVGDGVGFAEGRRLGWLTERAEEVLAIPLAVLVGRLERGVNVLTAALENYSALGRCCRRYGVIGVEASSIGWFGSGRSASPAAWSSAASPAMLPARLEGRADVPAAELVEEPAFGRRWCRRSLRGVAFGS